MEVSENVINQRLHRLLVPYQPSVFDYRPVPSRFGGRLIDHIGCAYGYYYGVETKRPSKDATTAQKRRLIEISQAGGAAFVIRDQQSMDRFQAWLDWCRAHPVNVEPWPRIG